MGQDPERKLRKQYKKLNEEVATNGGTQDPLKKYLSDAITLDQWTERYKGTSYSDIITKMDGSKASQKAQ